MDYSGYPQLICALQRRVESGACEGSRNLGRYVHAALLILMSSLSQTGIEEWPSLVGTDVDERFGSSRVWCH
jgi:hypothetical protein